MQCLICLKLIPDDAIVCPNCGSDIVRREPANAKQPSAPAARPAPTARPSPPTVVLRLDDATFVLTDKPEYIVGRRDTQNPNHLPDVDLTKWDKEHSTSRRQAKIILTREGAF